MSSVPIQLIVLAGIAIFLILKLRSVLGTRDGYEPTATAPATKSGAKLEVIEGSLDDDIINNVGDDASRSALAASRFFACKSAIASTSSPFFIFAAPSTPNCVATVFNFGSVIAASSGLCERTGSSVVVICFFSLLVYGLTIYNPWNRGLFFWIYLMCYWPI